MSDLISRQAAIEMLDEQIALCDKALKSFVISMKDEYAVKVERASLVAYKEQLEVIHAADVVPVAHARWVNYSPVTIKCSRCGHVIHDWRYSECKYCPNCGAKMDGGDEHG